MFIFFYVNAYIYLLETLHPDITKRSDIDELINHKWFDNVSDIKSKI